MQFKTTGKETFGFNMKIQKILGSIIINHLEIKKIRENSEFSGEVLIQCAFSEM